MPSNQPNNNGGIVAFLCISVFENEQCFLHHTPPGYCTGQVNVAQYLNHAAVVTEPPTEIWGSEARLCKAYPFASRQGQFSIILMPLQQLRYYFLYQERQRSSFFTGALSRLLHQIGNAVKAVLCSKSFTLAWSLITLLHSFCCFRIQYTSVLWQRCRPSFNRSCWWKANTLSGDIIGEASLTREPNSTKVFSLH